MNRALLIVICDFLLLSMLSLIDFTQSEQGDEAPVEEVVVAENLKAEQDLIEVLKMSLEAEAASREDLAGDLDLTQQELQEREETLAEREARLREMEEDLARREEERQRLEEERLRLEAERAELAEKVTETESSMVELTQAREATEEEARRAREEALRMERELREKLAELERTQTNLTQLEAARREAEEANRRLSTELELSESEKRMIRENLEQARTEVEVVRQEKARVQEQARELAQGVTTLAERSGELAQEVRRAQPKTSNTIFSEFLANRVEGEFYATRQAFLGPINRHERTRSILVSDGANVFAVLHLEDTALSLSEIEDWARVTGRLGIGEKRFQVRQISFLSLDPRVVAVQIDRATAESLGVKIYEIARDPFKFPEAVLINGSGNYYGESTFKLDPGTPNYVRMQTRIMTRLFGEFSPSTGDFVFSKSDELIGIMVNNEFCVLVDNFVPGLRMNFGEEANSSQILSAIRNRVNRLPLPMR